MGRMVFRPLWRISIELTSIQVNAPSLDGAFLVVRNGKTAFPVKRGSDFQALNG